MDKTPKIKLTRIIDFRSHKNLCRLCLNKFKRGEEKHHITKMIENQIYELIQIDLDTSANYSRTICKNCQQYLNDFTILKNDWIFRQIELRKYVDNKNDDGPVVRIKVEPEIMEDDDSVVFEETFHDDDVEYEDVKNETAGEEQHVNTWESEAEKFEFPKRKRTKLQRDHACKLCKAAFARAQTLENHYYYQHPETLTKEEIERIKRNDRLNRIRICPSCGIKTDHLKQHIRFVHDQIKNFFCDHCDYATFKKFNIRSHVQRHVQMEKKFTCEACGKKFSRKSAINAHMRDYHNDGRQFNCHCGRNFTSYAKLYKHKKWKHTDSKVPCPHCGKQIMKEGLVEHTRVDPEDKLVSYICTDCNQTFPNKRCLNHHRLIHQDRNFICDFLDCNRAFLSLAQLQSHQKWHTNAKSLKCPYQDCDKSYSKQQGLKIHIATKHENYKKKCPIPNCTYETGIFQDMRGHVKRHKDLKPDVLDEYVMAVRKLNLY